MSRLKDILEKVAKTYVGRPSRGPFDTAGMSTDDMIDDGIANALIPEGQRDAYKAWVKKRRSAKEKSKKPEAQAEEKQASLSTALDILWETDPAPLEKTAAAYMYDLRKPTIDHDLLGAQFCKLASSFERDPWELASEVEQFIDTYSVLSKTASNPRVLELAQFYNDWADSTMEKAALLSAVKALGGKALSAAKGLFKRAPGAAKSAKPPPVSSARPRPSSPPVAGTYKSRTGKGVSVPQRTGAPSSISVQSGKPATVTSPAQGGATKWTPKADPKAAVKKRGFSAGQKAIGAGLVAAPVMGAAHFANQMNQSQRGHF